MNRLTSNDIIIFKNYTEVMEVLGGRHRGEDDQQEHPKKLEPPIHIKFESNSDFQEQSAIKLKPRPHTNSVFNVLHIYIKAKKISFPTVLIPHHNPVVVKGNCEN